ncbi:MAG: phosphopantetheine-binding protein, partial [Microbacterium gubbeenense]
VRALRLPLAAGDSGGAPRGEEETEIARIFRDVLGASLGAREIGRDDDFFALGGDSITSLAVVSRARASGLEVTVPQIFEHPTVAALASVAMPTTAQSAPSDTAPLAASGLDDDELAGLLARVEGAA